MNIKGYEKLSPLAKQVFDCTYKKHQACAPQWIASQVKECKTYIKVIFTNGEWLHYTVNSWY